MTHHRLTLLSAIAAAATALPTMAVEVFNDDFNYVDSSAFEAAWTRADGSSGGITSSITTSSSSETVTPATAPVLKLSNGLYYDDLDQTLSGDWTLSTKLLHSQYSRSQMIFLTNAEGSQGYGIEWGGAGQPTQFGGDGYLRMRKLDLDDDNPLTDDAWSDWSTSGSIMGSTGSSTDHPVTGYEYISEGAYSETFEGLGLVQLTFDSATGTLTAYMDGVQKNQTTDTEFSSFGRVYIRGNTSGYFDDIVVDGVVPEPGSIGLMMIGSVMLLSRKRKTPDAS